MPKIDLVVSIFCNFCARTRNNQKSVLWIQTKLASNMTDPALRARYLHVTVGANVKLTEDYSSAGHWGGAIPRVFRTCSEPFRAPRDVSGTLQKPFIDMLRNFRRHFRYVPGSPGCGRLAVLWYVVLCRVPSFCDAIFRSVFRWNHIVAVEASLRVCSPCYVCRSASCCFACVAVHKNNKNKVVKITKIKHKICKIEV